MKMNIALLLLAGCSSVFAQTMSPSTSSLTSTIATASISTPTTIANSTLPPCICSAMNTCLQQEQQKLQTCETSSQCMALLGGNQSAVSSCVNTKTQQVQNFMQCMGNATGGMNMGCTNSSTPPQLPVPRRHHQAHPHKMQSHKSQKASAFGNFTACVKTCMNNNTNIIATCTKSLNCLLDKKEMKRRPGHMGSSAVRMCKQQQNGVSTTNSSIVENPCQCLESAGVQIRCKSHFRGPREANIEEIFGMDI